MRTRGHRVPTKSDVESPQQEQGYGSAKLIAVRAWAIIGCVVVFILAIQGLGMISDALVCLLTGIIVGFICSPITNVLEDHHVPRGLGSLVALIIVIAALVGIAVLLLPPFFQQLITLLGHIPGYIKEAQDAWSGFVNGLDKSTAASTSDLSTNITGYISSVSSLGSQAASETASKLSSGLITNLVSFTNTIFMIFLGLVLAYWFAKDYPKIVYEFATIAGPNHKDDLMLLFAVMSRSMGGYMRGIVITSCVGGFLSFIGFTIIGHPYAALMGITVGILHFVPVIGPWCAAAIAAVVALFVSPVLALESLLVSVIAQNVTDNVVSPVVMQSAVKVHPVMSLLGIVMGASLGGALGMALAIPLTAALKGVYIYYFETRTGRQLVSYDGALFKSTPFTNPSGDIVPSFDALDDDKFFETSRLVPKDRKEKAQQVKRSPRPAGLPKNMFEIVRDRPTKDKGGTGSVASRTSADPETGSEKEPPSK